MNGVHFVASLPCVVRSDGSICTAAFVAYGSQVPPWMNIEGLVPLDPSTIEERMEESEGQDVIKTFPRGYPSSGGCGPATTPAAR